VIGPKNEDPKVSLGRLGGETRKTRRAVRAALGEKKVLGFCQKEEKDEELGKEHLAGKRSSGKG